MLRKCMGLSIIFPVSIHTLSQLIVECMTNKQNSKKSILNCEGGELVAAGKERWVVSHNGQVSTWHGTWSQKMSLFLSIIFTCF